jgi:hypothetical protein
MKSKLISLSAITAGFIAIALMVGAYVEVADLSALILSSVFVIMPLYYKSYKASFLSSLVGGVIAFICSGFNIYSVVFPSYFVFFGVYPVVRHKMQESNMNKIVKFIIGAVWFLLTVYGMYFYYTLVMNIDFKGPIEWINTYILYLIAPIGLIIYVIYDKFIMVSRFIIDKYLSRIVK